MSLQQQIHEYYNFILPLVLQAGKVSVFFYVRQILTDSLKVMKEATDVAIEYKKDVIHDLVTVYDRKIEEVIIQNIKEKYPEHK